jgi:enterochelin esterase family protein
MMLSIFVALMMAQQAPAPPTPPAPPARGARPPAPPLVLLPGSPADRKPDDYTFGPDSMVHPGIPQGTWDKITWKSTIFPDTERFVWTYVPAQYDPKKPACLMVIQDGVRQYAEREDNRPAGRKAEYRVPTVLDNLIARGELPVIITVFVDPGSGDIKGRNGNPNFSDRSFEYDTLSDQYSQFLAKEILPPVEAKYNIRKDPAGRAIGGISSGAICAFTVAWNHPDWFGKVLSDVGSFTNIRGGHVYPQLVMDSPRKPIKIHMQDGINDNRHPDDPQRDWYLQNKAMHEALVAKGYEVKYVLGDGVHGSKHGGAILPDSLRWLWSDQVPQK